MVGSQVEVEKQVIDLMLQEPNLIRRPIVPCGGKAVFGFDAAAYDKVLR